MKKLFLSVLAITTSIAIKAQVPDMGFETWVNAPLSTTVQDPQGWATLNALTNIFVGMQQTVFKETTSVASGTASAKVVTEVIPSSVQIPNPFMPGQNLDTVGLLCLGTTQIAAPYIFFGKPYAARPLTLSFACKYTPMAGDSAFVVAFLTKWNTGTSKRDTLATGMYSTGATTTSYTTQTLNMTYSSSTAVPDTQQIFVSSSIYRADGAKRGSTFYVDDFAWSGWVGIEDVLNAGENKVSVYPNPANDNVNFNGLPANGTVEIMDVTGRLVAYYPVMNDQTTIQTSQLNPGLYIYNVSNNKKEVISRGRFEIAK